MKKATAGAVAISVVTPAQVELVQKSFASVQQISETAARLF
ncbi:MAG TPA: hypothetical protein VML19_23335 [Verrucomicrobiae bacterium]|nr:hypothetical protein [Verrucomicrobiae bacterium]